MLVHWPGQKRRHLCHEIYIDLIQKAGVVGAIPDLTIYVWNSKSKSEEYIINTKTLGICEESLEHRKIPFIQLGSELDKKWVNICKLECGFSALKNAKTTYTMTLDSSDIVVIGDIVSCFEKFKKSPHDVILNADAATWPFAFPHEFEKRVGRGPQRFLNSGAILGKTSKLITIYDYLLNQFDVSKYVDIDNQVDYCLKTDDQIRWKEAYQHFYPKMMVDYYCEYFQTINDINTWMIKICPDNQ